MNIQTPEQFRDAWIAGIPEQHLNPRLRQLRRMQNEPAKQRPGTVGTAGYVKAMEARRAMLAKKVMAMVAKRATTNDIARELGMAKATIVRIIGENGGRKEPSDRNWRQNA